MIDPVEQDINEYENQEAIQAALDVRIDDATDEAMKELTAVEMNNSWGEVDFDVVDAETFKLGNVEDLYHDILLAVRAGKGSDKEELILAQRFRDLIWFGHRVEIESITE